MGGRVDPSRLAIDGGSAGGYTTLACLAFTDVFSAGCSFYGVASLEALAGDKDKIVPPNQAQMMFDAAKDKGLPACLEMFPGEQHGFRQDANIRRVLDGEYSFYSQIFGFEPTGLPEGFEPVEIANFPPAT